MNRTFGRFARGVSSAAALRGVVPGASRRQPRVRLFRTPLIRNRLIVWRLHRIPSRAWLFRVNRRSPQTRGVWKSAGLGASLGGTACRAKAW